MKPRLLDLFCGAGGCSVGYAQAGFEVVGVDIAPQPHYPFEFHQADALTFPLNSIDAIHASPPCQAYSMASAFRRIYEKKQYPDLIAPVRTRLRTSGLPWVIENVIGAPMGHFVKLCGTQFGLQVYRHRQFESNFLLFSPGKCKHPQALLPAFFTVAGHQRGSEQQWQKAMGIDWMDKDELSQAIPPAYTRYIGQFLYDAVMQERQVAV